MPLYHRRVRPVILLQIENEFSGSSAAVVKYGEWAMHMAVALDTGVPWTFCNNSGSATYQLPPGLFSTANAGMGLWGAVKATLPSTALRSAQASLWTVLRCLVAARPVGRHRVGPFCGAMSRLVGRRGFVNDGKAPPLPPIRRNETWLSGHMSSLRIVW